MLLNDCLHDVRNILVVVFKPAMHLANDLLVVLALQVSQDLHSSTLRLLAQTHIVSSPVVDGRKAAHELVVASLSLLVERLNSGVDSGNVVCDVLDAIVQVRELILLSFDVRGEDVLYPRWDRLRRRHLGRGILLGVLLLCGFLVGLVLHGLLLLVSRIGEVLFVGLFAGVRGCGRYDELVDFEGVGVLGARGADTEVVVLRKLDLLYLVRYNRT